jgi:hypothetical protein
MLWMYTTVKLGHGQRLSSAWREEILQLHRSETQLYLLGVRIQWLIAFCTFHGAIVFDAIAFSTDFTLMPLYRRIKSCLC